MNVFIAWDGDHIGRQVGRASLNDDAEALRRISQAIDHGNAIWKSWVESHGGSIVSMGGDEGRAEMPADYLDELPKIREQYQGAVGSTVSVGVGIKLSEADRALIAAKLRGGDRIEFYTDEVNQIVANAEAQGQKTEEQKIADEYLNKAAPAMNPGAFAGVTEPAGPTMSKPTPVQGDHEEAADVAEEQSDQGVSSPEVTHAGDDFLSEFHDAARSQEQEDTEGHAQATKNLDDVKQKLVVALQMLKQQAPILEQVKQNAPDAYNAIMGLTQAVIGLSKQIQAVSPMQKSEFEDLVKDENYRVTAKKHPKRADDTDMYQYVKQLHTGSGADLNKIPMDTSFRLADVPLTKLPALRKPTEGHVQAYSKLKTPFPPIVIGVGGSIPDGHHRIAAARLRGDKSIRAYVPEQELHNYAMTAIKKSEFAEGSYPDRADDIGILDYFMTIHLGSRADFKNVPYDTEYKLVELPVSDIVTAVPSNNARAQDYAKRSTPFPPIIMKSEGAQPLDGNHRVAAAKIRGEETIRAYVPLQKAVRNPQDVMVEAVRGALSDDLRKKPYQGAANCMAGHCYVASEALYHILGAKEAGWTPMHVSHEGGPHWYLKNRHSGKVIDATADQFQTPVPYHLGKGKGFLTALPSKRANIVISRVLTRKAEQEETDLKKMAIADIPGGHRLGAGGIYDYSHVLPKQHQDAGYALHAITMPSEKGYQKKLHIKLLHNGRGVGYLAGKFSTRSDDKNAALQIDNSMIDEGHRGKGLGVPLYEAAYAHAKHILGLTHVMGKEHSSSAGGVHRAISEKHGLDYKPHKDFANEMNDAEINKPFDGRYEGYNYALKNEMKTESEPEDKYSAIEDGDLSKSGLPMPKASAHHRLNLPPGSAIGQARSGAVGSVSAANKVKVQHSDGSTGVVQVEAGQIRSQDPSGHPVSSRNPGGK